MKKVLSVLLSITIACGITFAAVAETDVEKGKYAILAAMRHIYDDTDYGEMFLEDTFTVYETNDEKILVVVQSDIPRGMFAVGMLTSIAILTTLWNIFADASAPYTDADVLFYVGYEDEDVFYVTKDGILDIQAGVSYNHYKP